MRLKRKSQQSPLCEGVSQFDGPLRQYDVTKMEMIDFDAERPRLTALATRILGSRVDADDIVQDTWLRFSRADGIDNLPAWLNLNPPLISRSW